MYVTFYFASVQPYFVMIVWVDIHKLVESVPVPPGVEIARD